MSRRREEERGRLLVFCTDGMIGCKSGICNKVVVLVIAYRKSLGVYSC